MTKDDAKRWREGDHIENYYQGEIQVDQRDSEQGVPAVRCHRRKNREFTEWNGKQKNAA